MQQMMEFRHYDDISDDERDDERLGLSDHWRNMKEVSRQNVNNPHHKFTPYVAEPLNGFGVQDLSPVAWSNDRERFAFVSGSFSIYVRSVVGNDVVVLNGHLAEVNELIFHPSLPLLVSAAADAIILWDITKGEVLQRMDIKSNSKETMHEGAVTCLAWGFDALTLYSGSTDMSFIVWRFSKNKLEFVEQTQAHKAAITTIVYNALSHRVSTADRDGNISIFDVTGLDTAIAQGQTKPPTSPSSPATTTASPAGAASSPEAHDDEHIEATRKRDLKNTVSKIQLVTAFEAHRGDVLALCFIQEGRILLSGGRDNTVRAWHLATGKLLRMLRAADGHTGDVCYITSISDNQILTASGDGTVKVWQLGADIEESSHVAPVESVSLDIHEENKEDDPDADVGFTGALPPLDTVLYTHQLAPVIACAAYCPQRSLILIAEDKPEVALWRTDNWQQLTLARQFLGHAEPVTSLLTRADGQYGASVVSASCDGAVLEHRIENSALIGSFTHPIAISALAQSSDGRFLFVAGGDYVVRIYERIMDNGNVLFSGCIAELTGHCSRITALAFCDETKVLATGSQDFHLHTYLLASLFNLPRAAAVQKSVVSQPVIARATPLPIITVPTHNVTVDVAAKRFTPVIRKQPGNGHVLALAFNDRADTLACALSDHSVRVYTIAADGTVGAQTQTRAHSSVVTSLAWGRGANTDIVYSSSADKTIAAWRVGAQNELSLVFRVGSPSATGHQHSKAKSHFGKVTDLAVSTDGTVLFSSSADETIVGWDAVSGEPLVGYGTFTTDGAFTSVCVAGNSLLGGTEKGMVFQFAAYKPGDESFRVNELFKKTK